MMLYSAALLCRSSTSSTSCSCCCCLLLYADRWILSWLPLSEEFLGAIVHDLCRNHCLCNAPLTTVVATVGVGILCNFSKPDAAPMPARAFNIPPNPRHPVKRDSGSSLVI